MWTLNVNLQMVMAKMIYTAAQAVIFSAVSRCFNDDYNNLFLTSRLGKTISSTIIILCLKNLNVINECCTDLKYSKTKKSVLLQGMHRSSQTSVLEVHRKLEMITICVSTWKFDLFLTKYNFFTKYPIFQIMEKIAVTVTSVMVMNQIFKE